MYLLFSEAYDYMNQMNLSKKNCLIFLDDNNIVKVVNKSPLLLLLQGDFRLVQKPVQS